MDQTTVYIAPADIVGTIILPSEISTVTIGTTTVIVEADPNVVIIESSVPATPSIIVAPDQTNVTIGGDDSIAVTVANPEITIIDSGIPAVASEAEEVHYNNATYPNVEVALDALLYVAPHIDSFSNDAGTIEMGTTLTGVTLAWTTNKAMTSLSLDHGVGSVLGFTSKSLAGLALATDTTFTLTASDGQNTTTAQTTIAFRNKRYWGVSASESLDSEGVLGLSSEFATDLNKAVTYDASGGRYVYYAFPASFGTPSHVTVGGLTFSDYTTTTLSFTNSSGHTEDYTVLRIRNMQTGIIPVVWA